MELTYAGQSGTVLNYNPPHKHGDWELVYNLKGNGVMMINGVAYPFSPGSIILCPPNTEHAKASEEGFEDCYLGISGWDLTPEVYALEDDQVGRVAQLLHILVLTWLESKTSPVCQDLTRAVIGLLQPMIAGTEGNKYVQMLRLRIIDRFTDPSLQMQELQEDMHINPDYLRRLFRQEHGMAPHEYLVKLRLDHAAHLLRYEGASVSEAAYRSGFFDSLYFSRLFRKHTGVSPTQWRKK